MVLIKADMQGGFLLEDNFKNTLFAFILISAFGMLILSAVVSVGDTYGKDTSEIVGGSLSMSEFNDSVSSIEANANSMRARFEKGSIWSSIAGVVVTGIFGIATDMIDMILSPFVIMTEIMTNIFHIPVWFSAILMSLLIFGIIFSIWRLIKIGD